MEGCGESVREASVAKCQGGISVGSSAHMHKYFFLLGSCCQCFTTEAQHILLNAEKSKHIVPTTTSEITMRIRGKYAADCIKLSCGHKCAKSERVDILDIIYR